MSSTPGKKRVGFSSEVSQNHYDRALADEMEPACADGPVERPDISKEDLRNMRESLRLALERDQLQDSRDPNPFDHRQRPRPVMRKSSYTPPNTLEGEKGKVEMKFSGVKEKSGRAAQRRAAKLSKSVGTYSAPESRPSSRDAGMALSSDPQDLQQSYELSDESMGDEDQEQTAENQVAPGQSQPSKQETTGHLQDDLHHTNPRSAPELADPVRGGDERTLHSTRYRKGVLGTLLRAPCADQRFASSNRQSSTSGQDINRNQRSFSESSTAANSLYNSARSSGTTTPNGASLARHHAKKSWHDLPSLLSRTKSTESLFSFKNITKHRDCDIRIKIHLAGTIARQNYLRKLCKALIMYGAPTHRIEEYLNMSARVLEIEAQFLYMPDCMIIAFDDSSVHTSEVKLVRTKQGLHLRKLSEVHEIYKKVIRDDISAEEAMPRLEAVIQGKDNFSNWVRVLAYGLGCATVGPFAFQARLIDLPISFTLGCLIGWLQFVQVPSSDRFSNSTMFEFGAAIITSFVARALGSIKYRDGIEVFCFSAIAQSGIAIILPGFIFLCASLELQTKHIVGGSIRMVYAIIYSLYLGYGITIGAALYGWMDKTATSNTQCHQPMSTNFNYLFVPAFAISLMIVFQADWKQTPAMTVIAFIGWVVNFQTSKVFLGSAQLSNSFGALAIGITANIHARFGRHVETWAASVWKAVEKTALVRKRSCKKSTTSPEPKPDEATDTLKRHTGHGLAAITMLPAIFVQVPSGLSSQGSLLSGITSADQIIRTHTKDKSVGSINSVNSISLEVAFSIVQITIGITIGLFFATLIVYPREKRRSGLFSF